MTVLKDRQVKILEFMKSEISKKGYPPTVREICTSLKIKSTSTVHKDISALIDAGYIAKDPNKPRALMVLNKEEPSKANEAETKLKEVPQIPDNIIDLPIVGQVAAGQPILAEENFVDSLQISSQYITGDNNFILTVKGESMIEAGIMDGDYIIVQKQETANNGDIVVAMINDMESEATVKTFYKKPDHVILQPENCTMDPIIVTPDQDLKIIGKVRGVLRFFS